MKDVFLSFEEIVKLEKELLIQAKTFFEELNGSQVEEMRITFNAFEYMRDEEGNFIEVDEIRLEDLMSKMLVFEVWFLSNGVEYLMDLSVDYGMLNVMYAVESLYDLE